MKRYLVNPVLLNKDGDSANLSLYVTFNELLKINIMFFKSLIINNYIIM
jgi:hypothetical protein